MNEHQKIAEMFKTQSQKERENRNVEMIRFFTLESNNNPEIKKTHLIKMVADKFKLTYSATRLILIKGGVYKSKI